ncbi:MAG: IS66 family transposase [Burkholderiaceae bacterium]
MLDVRQLKAEDLQGLDAAAASRIAALLLERVAAIDVEHGKQITAREEQIKFRDAKLQKLTFELARLKRLKFGVRTEAMTADQRRLFEETLAEDEADLQARIDALRGDKTPAPPTSEGRSKRQPRRQPIPEHMRRVEHHHEPEDTTCPAPDCRRPMVRIGEDVSERLDIVPAEFFAHRHIRGKWACKCCQTLTQEPVAPQLIDKGLPAPGLVAHVLVSRFVDHMPYYRQEGINARSGVHTPRTTLASWAGAAGAELEPLGDAHRAFVLSSDVLHADETPVPMLDPGAGKTKRAYIWGYARSEFDGLRGVVYDFCVGRGAKYPAAFLDRWNGTLVCDDYKGYEPVFKIGARIEAGCLVHARRKFEELLKNGHASQVAEEAVRRIGWIFWIERQARDAPPEQRLAIRQDQTREHWDKLCAWLRTERALVPDGSGIAGAIDYSLNRWTPLGHFLDDGNVSCHNNHLENLMRPWAMGRKAWLFAGSELAGKRAATVMSLVQSARLYGHDPWVYLRDVLTRLPTHPARDIDALLPHRWTPPPA